MYVLPLSHSGDSLASVYNCLIESSGSSAVPSPFPKQFELWKDGCFLYEPLNACVRPDLDTDSGLIYFKVGLSCRLSFMLVTVYKLLLTGFRQSDWWVL